jgi:hypothetical protein
MPCFLVPIRGNSDLARGLLGKAGIQNVVPSEAPCGTVPAGTIAARLSAESAEAAAERLRAVLEGEPFTVGVARREPGSS